MDEIYLKCREIIVNALNPDEDLIDVFAISLMALYMNRGQAILDKIPSLLEKTQIVRNNLGRTMMNIDIVGTIGNLSHKCTFTFPESLTGEDRLTLLSSTLYELIQLFRFNGFKEKTGSVEVRSGVSSRTVQFDGTTTSIRGKEIEDAIVISMTKNSLLGLEKLLDGEHTEKFPTDYKHDMLLRMPFYYDIRTYLIDSLMEDKSFSHLVDMTFSDVGSRQFINGYNVIMENDASFARLVKLFDQLSVVLPRRNDEQISSSISAICDEIESFKNKAKQLRK